jgi:phage gpG-like protein
LRLVFRSWRRFKAEKDKTVIKRFLHAVGDASEKAFKRGMRGAHSGTENYRTGKKRSAGGEYPANDSGALERSIQVRERATDVTIGTNTFYARFLRDGTRKMVRRKMSDNALTEGIRTARHELKGFVSWKRK